MQPSEINNLTTYEFKEYLRLLDEVLKNERDRAETLAQISSGRKIFDFTKGI